MGTRVFLSNESLVELVLHIYFPFFPFYCCCGEKELKVESQPLSSVFLSKSRSLLFLSTLLYFLTKKNCNDCFCSNAVSIGSETHLRHIIQALFGLVFELQSILQRANQFIQCQASWSYFLLKVENLKSLQRVTKFYL